MNRRFAELAQVRDLKGTREVLGELERRGWANPHSYAAAVHGLCRCGDWREAEAALGRAEAKRLFRIGSGIASGVIARTSMLRGYCECARDLSKARKLLARMERDTTKVARPNTRTANTFLRGCLQLGAVADAKALLNRMESQWGKEEPRDQGEGGEDPQAKAEGEGEEKGATSGERVGSPDASSYEMVVSLLCQALCYDEAAVTAKRALKQLGASPGSAGMFVSIARAAALRGDTPAAKASLGRCHHLVQDEERMQGKGTYKSDTAGSGGKRATWKLHEDGQDGSARVRSLEVFLAHRRSEVRAELKEVEAFMEEGKEVDLSSLWRRTLAFEELGTGLTEAPVKGPSQMARKRKRQALQAAAAQEGIAGALCRRLSQAFGLPAKGAVTEAVKGVFKVALSHGKSGAAKAQLWKQRKARAKAKAKAEAAGAEPSAQGGKRLDLSCLFETPKKSKPRPVNIEVCSGGGEWLCAQALRDPSACWVACEVRFDRAARCFQRLALRGLAAPGSNAGLIVGDAHDALQSRLAPGSCAQLFVNHPEPPHQTDLEATRAAEKESAGGELPAAHLLTVPFLRDACGSVLQPGGTLTICTDSVDYGRFLLDSVASKAMAGVYEDALSGTPAAKVRRLAQEGGFGLRAEPPPAEVCGAEYKGEDGASYFQRLKFSERSSRGQTEEDRFFICLRRLKT
uniref:tRNA (guanine(46)-N(7))-methyltransferase n=1 Tax=Alexandrium catenella TaxID=2925 RepID=A0A7S1RIE9_ALECA